jgi:hypothetical protein
MSTRLPQVVLKEDVNWTNITFKGRGFAWVNHSENRAMIKARHDARAALLATAPAVYEVGWATPEPARVDTPQRSDDHHAHPLQAGGPHAGHTHHGQPSSA